MFEKNFKKFAEDSAAHHWQTKAFSEESPFSGGYTFDQLLKHMNGGGEK